MGKFWNKAVGSFHAPPSTSSAADDKASRRSSTPASGSPAELGPLPSKSARQLAHDAADVLRIMRRRPLASLVGLGMDVKDLVRGGAAPLPAADPGKALKVLRDPEQAASLQTPPIYVRPGEAEGVNRHAFELGSRFAKEGAPVPLRQELDTSQRYLWAMTAPRISGEAPGIHLGREHEQTDANGRTGKLGHPSVLNASLGPGGRHEAVFAGELFHQKGRWVIDNNSGRWFGGHAAGLKQLGLHKRDLFAAAAHHLNAMSDLDIREAKQLSRNPLRFVEQLVGVHQPKAVSLKPSGDE